MHREVVVGVLSSTQLNLILTLDVRGILKIWKKNIADLVFLRGINTLLDDDSRVSGFSISEDGTLCAITGIMPNRIVLFDLQALDILASCKLPFTPGRALCFVPDPSLTHLFLIPEDSPEDSDDPKLHKVKINQDAELALIKTAATAKTAHILLYNDDIVITVSESGSIDYLSTETLNGRSLDWDSKLDTDLFDLEKYNERPLGAAIAPNKELFAIISNTMKLRLFRAKQGKLCKVYDESTYDEDNFDPIDLERRKALEEEILSANAPIGILFDESSKFLLISSLAGIKIIDIERNRVECIIGRNETERFLAITCLQTLPPKVFKTTTMSSQPTLTHDPFLVATAWKRSRFYLFTQRSGDGPGRDIMNELPTKAEIQKAIAAQAQVAVLPQNVIMYTTLGDVEIRLFPKETPKTVENFTGLARSGFYDGVLFHRVIKGFMIQTGDDGTGGSSIWGKPFSDEFNKGLRHDKAYTVSMANCGPNTNGSQFFITTAACPHLDDKHTVFGRVVSGFDVIDKIENVKTNSEDKPLKDIRILTVKVVDQRRE